MVSIYTREETPRANNNSFEYRKYYQKNKARISRRRVLLAISKGRCVAEKTIDDPKYQWNDAEKERLRECIKLRRDSYLTLPVGQFQDKRYYINNRVTRRSSPQSPEHQIFNNDTNQHSPSPTSSPRNVQRTQQHIEQNSPSNDERQNVQNVQNVQNDSNAIENECSNKLINRRNINIDFSVKPADSPPYDEHLTQSLVIELLSSLYDEEASRHHPNETKRTIRIKMNANTVKMAFKYMQIDDALDIFRYPERALQMINLNLQYLDMLNYVKIFTDITFNSKNNNFNTFIEKKVQSFASYSWLRNLTDDDETYIKKGSIILIEDKVKLMIRNKRDATTKKLRREPYYNWQHICNTIELVEESRLTKDQKNEYRLMIQLYTRELVVRDDYGSIKVFFIRNKNTLDGIKTNSFLKDSYNNCIFKVEPKYIDTSKIKYIDDVQIFKAAAKNTKRKLNINNKYNGVQSHPYVYILYFMHFKTYKGFDNTTLHPFLLKQTTCNYIHEYLEHRKVNIPDLPKTRDDHQPEKDVYLFGRKKDNKENSIPYDENKGGKLGSKISRMFKTLTDLSITINDIRHSYSSYFRTKYSKDVDGEKDEVIVSAAHRMFHSYDTHINSYTHTSNKIYSFPQKIHDKLKYDDNIITEKLVKKETYKPKVLGLTNKHVNVLYHVQTSFDTKTSVVHLNMQGIIVWDERDTIVCSIDNNNDEVNIDEDNDNEQPITGGVRNQRDYILVRTNDNQDMLNVFENLSYRAQAFYFDKKVTDKNKNEYQIRIRFDNNIPDLLTNTLNPFLQLGSSKKTSKLISFIGKKFTFPNYTSIFNNKTISISTLLKNHVPLKLEVARLKRFQSEKQKKDYENIYKHCPSELQAVKLQYNENVAYAYDYVNLVELPFVLIPTNQTMRERGSERLCRYMSIEDLETFITNNNKQKTIV